MRQEGFHALDHDADGKRVSVIYLVRNPDKLRRVASAGVSTLSRPSDEIDQRE